LVKYAKELEEVPSTKGFIHYQAMREALRRRKVRRALFHMQASRPIGRVGVLVHALTGLLGGNVGLRLANAIVRIENPACLRAAQAEGGAEAGVADDGVGVA
jgi:hypothetical protein